MAGQRYVGAHLKRVEDPRLLTGGGRYVDDLRLPGLLHLAVVRSTMASGRIMSIDASAARTTSGVVAVLTGEDTRHLGSLPTQPLPDLRAPRHPPLAEGVVRYVGEPVAVVVAESAYAARDAAALVEVAYEPLPAVVDAEQALASSAPPVHPELGDNVALRRRVRSGEVDAAFARAHRVVSLRVAHGRVASVCMEPRGVLAEPGPGGELTLWCSTQFPFLARDALAAVLGVPLHQVRVIAPDVGGGFGAKGVYREDVLAAYLALRLGRAVKWVATRLEDLVSTAHGRDMVSAVEAAVEADGRVLALRARTVANLGAYPSLHGPLPPLRLVQFPTGAYDIPNLDAEVVEVYTHTVPTGPYRGAGRPEATFLIERLLDAAAQELGLDPAEVRRRNFIPAERFPYRNASGIVYDSGNYARALDRALALADMPRLRHEQAERRARGELVGIGLSTYVEVSGGGWESGLVRVERSGAVTAVTGASPHGQGHETSFAQVVADALGLPPEQVLVKHGDTALGPPGNGTFGSRSTLLGGSALHQAACQVRDKLLRLASHRLEAAPADLVLEDGAVRVRGAPERAIRLQELAQAAYALAGLPPGESPGLEATVYFQAERDTFPFGAYIAVVSVDPHTARVTVERLVAVDDCGNAINPLLVEGQLHGGIAQGLGETLLEEIVYDADGQPLTSSLLDYAVPRADDLPPLTVDRTVTPSPLNPLGAKGVGEAGTVGAPPALANAVVDALSPLGVTHLDMPITPHKLWQVLRTASRDTSGV